MGGLARLVMSALSRIYARLGPRLGQFKVKLQKTLGTEVALSTPEIATKEILKKAGGSTKTAFSFIWSALASVGAVDVVTAIADYFHDDGRLSEDERDAIVATSTVILGAASRASGAEVPLLPCNPSEGCIDIVAHDRRQEPYVQRPLVKPAKSSGVDRCKQPSDVGFTGPELVRYHELLAFIEDFVTAAGGGRRAALLLQGVAVLTPKDLAIHDFYTTRQHRY